MTAPSFELRGARLRFTYSNWRGEVAERYIKVMRLEFKETPWHSVPQWVMVAQDLDKDAEREFAMRDMSNVRYVDSEEHVPVCSACGKRHRGPTRRCSLIHAD